MEKWSFAPELGFHVMPYSFTSGKTLSPELDIVERGLHYLGFYGLQGPIAMEYQVSSRYRLFGGFTYQSDLSNPSEITIADYSNFRFEYWNESKIINSVYSNTSIAERNVLACASTISFKRSEYPPPIETATGIWNFAAI